VAASVPCGTKCCKICDSVKDWPIAISDGAVVLHEI
jgi:hypothetical protein